MANRLYKRSKATLNNTTNIIQPTKPSGIDIKINNTLGAYLGKLAEENFALGEKQVMEDVITNAYRVAPNDVKKFDELVNQGMGQAGSVLTPELKTKLNNDMYDKIALYRNKVETNYVKQQDEIHTQRVGERANQIGSQLQLSYGDKIDNYFNGAIAKNPGEADLYKQNYIKADNEYNRNVNELNALSGAKNFTGKNIISQSQVNAITSANRLEIMKEKLYNFSADELKTFDANTLQDRKAFMEKTGCSAKEYDSLCSWIEKRIKEFDADYKRQIKEQKAFNIARNFNPMIYNREMLEKQGTSPEILDNLDKIKESAGKVATNPLNADAGFIGAISELQHIINESATPEQSEEFLKKGSEVALRMNMIMNNSDMSDDEKQAMNNALYKSITDQTFADTIKPIFDTKTALGEFIDNIAGLTKEERTARNSLFGGATAEVTSKRMNVMKYDVRVPNYSNEQVKAMNNIGRQGIQTALVLGAMGKTEQAQEVLNNLNSEMIKMKFSNRISPETLDDLRKKKANGEPALYNYGGMTFEYLGETRNNINWKKL